MSKDQLLTRIASIISALSELDGCPESHLYIFLDMDMDLWQKVRYILVNSGNVKITGNYVTLTPFGRETAERINKVIASKGN